MKVEIAKIWVDALRSGEYIQTKSILCNFDPDTKEKKYCCLGVLSNIAAKEGICEINIDTDEYNEDPIVKFDSYLEVLPESVMLWAGISSKTGKYGEPLQRENNCDLAQQNDTGATFKQIADIIEDNVENL